MDKRWNEKYPVFISIVCFLIFAVLVAGCTTTISPPATIPPATTISVQPTTSASFQTVVSPSVPITAVPSKTTAVAVTSTPSPRYTPSEKTLVVFTAASLKGASGKLGTAFSAMYPGDTAVFNLDGTQNLKIQVENGAYADAFISASNAYTNTLKSEGFFINSTIKPLTTNYVIVILPASNPGNIKNLADLAKPGVKIAIGDKTVPVGTATSAVLANLAKSTYSQDWNKSVYNNVVTYETTEPGVATKVALGEVDAGFVYESTYSAAPKDTYSAITIPKDDNYLQTYTIGVMQQTRNSGVAQEFEDFMLSGVGQQILRDYGFRPVT